MRKVEIDEVVAARYTDIVHWFFLVQVIQAGGYMSRPHYSGPNPAVWFKEMRREHAIKFTFDPVNPYPIRDKVVAREAMPLFSIADS